MPNTPVFTPLSSDPATIKTLIDATNLKPTLQAADVTSLLESATTAKYASVCIPLNYVAFARNWLSEHDATLPICTVIGFPLGYVTSEIKLHELELAQKLGASELDVVVDISAVLAGDFKKVKAELKAWRAATSDKIIKLIIECCYLNQAQKVQLCELVSELNYDFIKTSTGFGSGGATLEDVALLRANCAPTVLVKASGGIRSLEQAQALVQAGASRLGISNPDKLFS